MVATPTTTEAWTRLLSEKTGLKQQDFEAALIALQALNIVPKYPALGYLLLCAVALGAPFVLKALLTSGGPRLTRVATLHGCAMAAVLAYMSVPFMGTNLFVWHVIGMSLGVFAFQPAALHSILAKHSSRTVEARKSKARDHKMLQMASCGCMLAGFFAIFLNKPPGFPGMHFMTVHSLVGLTALSLMAWNALHGAYRQGNPIFPKLLWASWIHRATGTLAFVSAMLAAALGLFNRTVVVDWAAAPITFSLPEMWNRMDGWAHTNLGEPTTLIFIGGILFLMGMMLLAGQPAADEPREKTA
uniref:Cytochrome b561 domain-containing protein n=1 Tax=Zooxanthella nutricula TaxID=1333877 RepID=A0A6U9E758_9DINO|mmetsp:Transcript_55658/g.169356  ORF Transcript_55658/g.169356 Transcript_55658/m.169356 type:complete len:301 (+) Transcript_55658:102-1004(+)